MNVLDLFSGIGGFSLGLERAGMTTVAFCEIDPICRKVLKKHWPNVPVFEDVSTLTKDCINANIDVIAGGFPCQDISLAGRGAGLAGERSGLWFQYHRLIKEIQPRYAVIENVSALRSRGLDEVLRSLAEIGYDAEWHCIPASAVGAPHQRDRIWIVAYTPLMQCNGSDDHARECLEGQPIPKFGNGSGENDVADAGRFNGNGRPNIKNSTLAEAAKWGQAASDIEQRRQMVADTNRPQLQGRRISSRVFEEHANISCPSWWEIEPDVGRVAYGVPAWAHRLKQLGNAVVPQIPELIGRAIIDYENSLS
jgi:DNA (cytosine-5)-methyltransferase 1